MTTRLLLIRHGATTLSAEDRFAGATDVDLSDEGRLQAKRLGERLAARPIVAVYCSPMKRTRETAAIVAAPHRVSPQERDGLREIDHGRWEGLRRSEVEARHPEEYAAWEADPFTFAPQDGESVFRAKDKSGAVTESKGEYLTVWAKQPDGRWQVVFDTGSTLP